jgi:hypothetical protein
VFYFNVTGVNGTKVLSVKSSRYFKFVYYTFILTTVSKYTLTMRILLILALITGSMSACLKDLRKIKHVKIEEELNSDWVLPLVKTKLTLRDALPDSLNNFYIDQNGILTLYFQNKVLQLEAKQYMQLPDQTISSGGFNLSAPITQPSWSGIVSDTFSGSYSYADPNGAQLHHVNLKGGAATCSVTNGYAHQVAATIIFSSIVKNGQALSIPISVAPNSSISVNVNLSSYNIDLTKNNTSSNYLPYTIAYQISGTGAAITAGDNLTASISLKSLDFLFIDGYIGKYTIAIPEDSIDVSVFNNVLNGSVYFEDPQLELAIGSSIGVDVFADLSNLTCVTKAGVATQLSGPAFATPLAILAPTIIGQTRSSTFTANKLNSNIQTALSSAPQFVRYSGSAQINSAGGTSTYNFITDSSKIRIDAKLTLPANLKVSELRLQDSFDIANLPKDTGIVESLEVKVRIENAIGVTNKLQVYFETSSGQIVDSLLSNDAVIFPEAAVDATTGFVTTPSVKTVIVKLTRDQYKRIALQATKGRVVATVKTSGSNSVIIRDTDYADINMAARAILKLNVNL